MVKRLYSETFGNVTVRIGLIFLVKGQHANNSLNYYIINKV